MMTLISACLHGNVKPSKDLCDGAYISYFDNIRYSRAEKEGKIANNEFACSKCKAYLSNEEILTCNAWIDE